MTYAQFQENWEKGAKDELIEMNNKSVSDLLGMIKKNNFGHYYSIWYSIASRGKLIETYEILIKILKSKTDYLNRYHCAKALIGIAQLEPGSIKPEMLSAEKRYKILENINEIENQIINKLDKTG